MLRVILLEGVLSSWEQFLPTGLTFSIPFLNSIKVPLFTGMSISASSFNVKLIKALSLSSPRCFIRLCVASRVPALWATNPFSENR